MKNPEKTEKKTPKEERRYESQTNLHEFELTYNCDRYRMDDARIAN